MSINVNLASRQSHAAKFIGNGRSLTQAGYTEKAANFLIDLASDPQAAREVNEWLSEEWHKGVWLDPFHRRVLKLARITLGLEQAPQDDAED
jgi:hypothetical protein